MTLGILKGTINIVISSRDNHSNGMPFFYLLIASYFSLWQKPIARAADALILENDIQSHSYHL